jgi:hypothetical protein
MKNRLKRAIISIFEPLIQAMITERIIMFRTKLESDGVIPRPASGHQKGRLMAPVARGGHVSKVWVR